MVAFVITASAFAFVVLNMGMLSADQAQSVISSSVEETSAALMMDTDIIGTFSNTTGTQSTICLTKATFYVRLSQGNTPIDMDDSKVVITYTQSKVPHRGLRQQRNNHHNHSSIRRQRQHA